MNLYWKGMALGVVAAGLVAGAAGAQGAPTPDPRVGLHGGTRDAMGNVSPAGEAAWNMRLLSNTRPPAPFLGQTNSDLAFTGKYVIQGNYAGPIIWDLSNPRHPVVAETELCPASQNDVSIYKNLMIVSSEDNSGRLDCGAQGIKAPVSAERLRGVRIFDISDLHNPKYVANVQTCRGSHTHTIVTSPKDPDNFYIYISGQAPVRPSDEMPGCSSAAPDKDPASSRFRIDVIKVPVAHPEKAAIVGAARIFNDLAAPPTHGLGADDVAVMDAARKSGAFIADIGGEEMIVPSQFVAGQLDSIIKARKGVGAPTGADSAAFRAYLPTLIKLLTGSGDSKPTGPDQCHDITVYPAIGLAGGACAGYGMLLDIRDPAHPVRIGAVSDSNFSYWHSATFNNDGTKILFTDEWGGGGAPKCRATDKKEWGADAIFAIEKGKLVFQSYYKMPAAQTNLENCVAHNGSLIPIPGRDVMVQAWYQGGVSVFDWTDAAHPKEIAFFDRGPVDSTTFDMGGSWSVYWYNGLLVSSEIARGLDVFELSPSAFLSQNEIDAAKTVRFDQLNVQDQQKFVWPPSFALAKAYVDQLERSNGLSVAKITATRNALVGAEKATGGAQRLMLNRVISQLGSAAAGSSDAPKVQLLLATVRRLADAKR